jgi:hypothetical protein
MSAYPGAASDSLKRWLVSAMDWPCCAFLGRPHRSIVEDDFVLWESNTICRYLACTRHRDDLLPTSPAARARVEQWMDWQATDLNTAWRHAFMSLVRESPAYSNPRAP